MKLSRLRGLAETGFTLITALFLLVVVAILGGYMVKFSGVQHTTMLYGIQGARAMQAARAGLEWGIHEAVVNDNCAAVATVNTIGAGSLDDFNITVNCASSNHSEIGQPVTTFQITSSATFGTFGTLDFVFRQLQATVSDPPP